VAEASSQALENAGYRLETRAEGRLLRVRLIDRVAGFTLADGPYTYSATRAGPEGSIQARWLESPVIETAPNRLTVSGRLAGLSLRHQFSLPADTGVLEERIVLHNPGKQTVHLEDFQAYFSRRITNTVGEVLPELAEDRWAGVPFRHRATDIARFDVDLTCADLLRLVGRSPRTTDAPLTWPVYGSVPAPCWASEGWAWERGSHATGIFTFNQEGMSLSQIGAVVDEKGARVRFGGAGMFAGDPSALTAIAAGQTVALGITRYVSVANDRREAWYAFRSFLSDQGCALPSGFDPPVHWNELYDNPEWNLASAGTPAAGPTRQVTYTRALLEVEAAKAKRYGCQSLYLDPGWDTAFGTFQWGEKWLGSRKDFIRALKESYGLGLSLHCPLATWMSLDARGTTAWPRESFQMDRDGKSIEGAVCLGSRQYLDLAEQRLLEHCADGVGFLMFDGNWWNGGCWNPEHGHAVPYTLEDHCRAQIDLAQRIHARFPLVLIEMHDTVSGGAIQRHTPVYYKYGLPGSFDDNWGFELMWQPMEDILAGRARSLYWYNMGCNVPIYLHIDLRDDNEHCLVLWWYASTCRHLGIGGTHPDPLVADAQVRAMATYRRLERFFKRGAFFGLGEDIHAHALPSENAFIVNLFNLSDQSRIVEGSIRVDRMGLNPDLWYVAPKGARFDKAAGAFVVGRRMAPWSAEVMEVYSVPL